MAKRFVDTSLWKRKWYRCLPPKMKLFYFYMITNCDHAGMYDVDLELAEFQIGMPVKQEDVDKYLKDHIEIIKEDKWFIKAFPEFQYGVLNPNVKAHASVMKILDKYNCLQTVPNSLETVSSTVKDKDKVKSKYKDKEKGMNPDILKVSEIDKKKIGYREVMFKRQVSEFAEKYSKDMRIDFVDWYTESDGKTMLWEKIKKKNGVFDVGRRLARWKKNNFNKKEETANFTLDSTNKFYLGWCKSCNKSDTYSLFELKSDSRCCQSKLMPKKQ